MTGDLLRVAAGTVEEGTRFLWSVFGETWELIVGI